MTLFPELQPAEMHDTKYMPAGEKTRVLKQWQRFLKNGCQKGDFTIALYEHLIQHCSFIAHYDIKGFWDTYFARGEDTVHFLKQFDNRNGVPDSIEYGYKGWYLQHDYHDINAEMCRIAAPYMNTLIKTSHSIQRLADIAAAKTLLAKHNIELKEVKHGGD